MKLRKGDIQEVYSGLCLRQKDQGCNIFKKSERMGSKFSFLTETEGKRVLSFCFSKTRKRGRSMTTIQSGPLNTVFFKKEEVTGGVGDV